MNWFVIALFAPALWGITNYIEKYLISRYFKEEGFGAMVILSTLTSILVFPLIYVFHPAVFGVSVAQVGWIFLSEIIITLGVVAYFYALRENETSLVVPLFQTVPIFAFLFGYLLLGETLTDSQLIGSLLIFFASVSLSIEFGAGKMRFKKSVFFLMVFSSALIALSNVIFKIFAEQLDFSTAIFWLYLGDFLIGLVLLIVAKEPRRQFLHLVSSAKVFVGLSSLNTFIGVVADFCVKFSSLFVPVALVWVLNGFQPFFVFVYGVILTLLLPHVIKESLAKRHLAHKIIAIAVMFAGTYFLGR